MRSEKRDTRAGRRTAASRAGRSGDACSPRSPPVRSPTASARSPSWGPREPAGTRPHGARGGGRPGGLPVLRGLRVDGGRLRPAGRGCADPRRADRRDRPVPEGTRPGGARSRPGGRGAHREDGVLGRARRRVRPGRARPGDRVRDRGAHLRLADRPRPGRRWGQGPCGPRRGGLPPPVGPRGRPGEDGASGRADVERRDGAVRAVRTRGDRRVQGRPEGDQVSAEAAYLLLADGTRLDGDAVGAPGPVTGEVVFTTGMSGYQESMTDPSFARQLITFTYPHIGNYGVSAEAMESDRVHARAAIMRAAVNREDAPGAEAAWLDWLRDCGVPAITGVDTRELVRHIRDAGAMRGGVFPARVPEREALDLVHAEPPMA